jgi:hypothetical protein
MQNTEKQQKKLFDISNICLVLFILFFSSSIGFAISLWKSPNSNNDNNSKNAAPEPDIVANIHLIDFGTIKKKELRTATLHNRSTKTISILYVVKTCGCTAVDVSEAPFLAGTKRDVTVTLEPSGQTGQLLRGDFVVVYADTTKPDIKHSIAFSVTGVAGKK